MMRDRCIFLRIPIPALRLVGGTLYLTVSRFDPPNSEFSSRLGSLTPDLNGICEKIYDRLPIIFNLTKHQR
jgi:hypothetical protein